MSRPDDSDRNVPAASNGESSPALQSEEMFSELEGPPVNDLLYFLSIFLKHKWTILVSFLVLSILGCAAAFGYNKWFYKPVFQATSSILVKSGWENYYPDPSLGNSHGPDVNLADMLGAEISILESRQLKEKVISALTPEAILPKSAVHMSKNINKQDMALLFLDRHLKIKHTRGSVIDVEFDGANPQSAAAVVNQLVNDYIDKRSQIYKDPKVSLFLQNKVNYYRNKLAESLDNMKAFSERTKIYAFDHQRDALLDQRSTLSIALNSTANEIKGLQQTNSELEKELKAIPKSQITAAASGQTGGMQAKLIDLKLKEMELSSKYQNNSPELESLRAQIAAVKNYLKKNSPENPNIAAADPLYQDIQKQIIDNKAKLSNLNVIYAGTKSQLDQANNELQAFEANETQYRTLAAAVSSNTRIYSDYRQKLEEANVYNELGRDKMTSVSVIEPALPPISPVNFPKPLFLLFAIAIGFSLLASLAIAYIAHIWEMNKQAVSTWMQAGNGLDHPEIPEGEKQKSPDPSELSEIENERWKLPMLSHRERK